MEIRDDSKTTFDEAIGLSTYSNSKAGVLSYVGIFEKLWNSQTWFTELSENKIGSIDPLPYLKITL